MRSFRFFLCPCTPLRASSYQKCPLLMRVKGQRVVCLEGAGSPGHTQSLTLALYLNQALGFQLPLSKAILLTSSRSLISFVPCYLSLWAWTEEEGSIKDRCPEKPLLCLVTDNRHSYIVTNQTVFEVLARKRKWIMSILFSSATAVAL